ncbi:unnamed protein product [Brachionus calyciflorus]|uniref:Integrase catalytic domain-containing protein n=1 Tax=Brachionus calyciflorus TaxID=104777 RepID=A0A814RRS7_9BILA|nr:unnamed protein product [Brachionus calyciflorus]
MLNGKAHKKLHGHVWFNGIDQEVEECVETCQKCQVNSDTSRFEPLNPSPIPTGPLKCISIDFYVPLRCGSYLMVIICEYSKYPLVYVIPRTTAAVVVLFSTFGIPEIVKTDNGPPFSSFVFSRFAREQGFKHRKITPLWPRANGMCERFMQNLGKVMRNSSITRKEWEAELIEFLRNYRSTPHSSTGFPPSQVMFKAKSIHKKVLENDSKAKAMMKVYGDKKLKTCVADFKIDEFVLVKWNRRFKSDSIYDPTRLELLKSTDDASEKPSVEGSLSVDQRLFHEFGDLLMVKDDDVIQNAEPNVGDVPEVDVTSELKSENRVVIKYGNDEVVSVKEVVRPKRNTRPPDRYENPVLYGVKSNNQQ